MPASPFATSLSATRALRQGPSPSLVEALHSDHPAVDQADKMALYGWLIGRWEMDSVIHSDDGTKQSGPRGEIHFGWVLEGRAIQDVWALPGFFYGTTLRVYDPALDAWHILWSDPLKQVLHAADRPCTRQRHRPGGHRRGGNAGALEFHRDNAQFVPLARRTFPG